MSNSPDRLYELLPMFYRQRDAEHGWPLRDLLRVIAEQVDVVEADIAQLYDNWFIETCEDWVVPYIGDLVGYQHIHNADQLGKQGNQILITRREVANTIGYRQRKGTLTLLELLANNVAGWPARVVEFQKLLSKTGNINHLQQSSRTVDLRQGQALQRLDSSFDEIAHLIDVHSMGSPHDPIHYNIHSLGIFVWRLKAYSVTKTQAFCLEEVSSHCYTFSITGNDTPLFTRPEPESKLTQTNLPIPIRRQMFESYKRDYYGSNKSLQIWLGTSPVPTEKIIVADLSDWSYQPPQNYIAVDPELGRFAFPPRQLPKNDVWVSYQYGFSADIGGGEYDRPLLNLREHLLLDIDDIKDTTGLIAKLKNISAPSRELRSQFSRSTQNLFNHHRNTYPPEPQLLKVVIAELNRILLGESFYDVHRFASITLTDKTNRLALQNPQGKERIRLNRLLLETAYPNEIAKHYTLYKVGQNSGEYHRINDAILQWQVEQPRYATIEIIDSGVYVEHIRIDIDTNQSLELRAANCKRPTIRLLNWRTALGDALNVTVKSGSCFTLDGLLITGRGVRIETDPIEYEYGASTCEQKPTQITIRHSTLVPGWTLHCDCQPRRSNEPSLELFNIDAHVKIEHSIIGAIEVNQNEVHDDPIPIYISDSIIDATSVEGKAISSADYPVAHTQLTIKRCTVFGQIRVRAIDLAENSIFDGQMHVIRRQLGCIRFCYIMPNSRTPRRYNCQPDQASYLRPQFNSTRYGTPTYCQLADNCADEIKQGADDESEIGVFHDLYQPQRVTNLRVHLDEYTPAGMEAGIIYAT
ncbi:MAG: hypothetical protein V7L00_29645 [Nostoc sp.]|uniref:hypothetical protein n=1 Tax=Nostoc sp. TaxID=1180 RepID=UPI002FFA1BF4